jgi:hypothetical protein
MSVPPGEYSDSETVGLHDQLSIPLRVSPGFPPGSLDRVAARTIALARFQRG